MIRRALHLATAGLVAFAAGVLHAGETSGSGGRQEASGTIRIWGTEYMSGVLDHWMRGFQESHPGVTFEVQLRGTGSAMPALYTGRADIALLGRENDLTDNNGFGRVKQYPPTRLELLNGSLDEPGMADALVVFVHRDNPLERISLAELDAAFGHEGRRGLPAALTWGDLGLPGAWAQRPVNLHAYHARTGTGRFFQDSVLGKSRKMRWPRLKEYRNSRYSDGTVQHAARQILDALADDPDGLAIAGLRYAHAGVKPVALSVEVGGRAHHATVESLVSGDYPLARRPYAFVDVPPGGRLDPTVRAFLGYVLGERGQADVRGWRGYLPLGPRQAEAQRRLLETR